MFALINGANGYMSVRFTETYIYCNRNIDLTFDSNGKEVKLTIKLPEGFIHEEHYQDAILLILTFFNEFGKPIVNDKWLQDNIIELLTRKEIISRE